MSVRYMSMVWEYSQHKGVQLLLLLAIADHCNDDGLAYPSIGRLAKKIRRSERTTQRMLRKLLDSRPTELFIVRAGGTKERPDQGHLFRVAIKPHENGVSDQMRRAHKGDDETLTGGGDKTVTPGGEETVTPGGEETVTGGVRKLSPGGVTLSVKGGDKTVTQTVINKPPILNHQLTATAVGAAAAVAHGEWWELSVLIAAGKLPAAHRKALSEANPSPGAYVSKYLYALGKAGFKKPPLWAAKQVSENPGAWEGEPYESLAALGPAGVAKVLAWLSADCSYSLDLNGSMPLALKLRADLQDKYRKTPGQLFTATADAIADLGLAGLVQPGELEERVPEPSALLVPALDEWQALLSEAKRDGVLNPASWERLSRSRLVSCEGGRYVVSVPTRIELDYITHRLANFTRTVNATFQLQEE